MVAANRSFPWPYVIGSMIVVCGGLIGLILAMYGTVQNDGDVSALVIATLLGALLALALVLTWGASQPFHFRRQIPVATNDVYRHAEAWFGRAPWALSRNDGRDLVFWRRTEPVLGVVLILLILGVVPGILYYFWARGTQTVYLSIRPLPDGTDLEVLVQPRGGDGRNRVADFFNSLHRYAPR